MSDTAVRQEAGPPGEPVSYQWYCRACREFGAWTTDEAQANRDADQHECPGQQETAPPRP